MLIRRPTYLVQRLLLTSLVLLRTSQIGHEDASRAAKVDIRLFTFLSPQVLLVVKGSREGGVKPGDENPTAESQCPRGLSSLTRRAP